MNNITRRIVAIFTALIGVLCIIASVPATTVHASATSHTITVNGAQYQSYKESGSAIHWETPDITVTSAFFAERGQVWTGNGSDNLPCFYGIHWISNVNVLTISHCLPAPVETTVTPTTVKDDETTTTVKDDDNDTTTTAATLPPTTTTQPHVTVPPTTTTQPATTTTEASETTVVYPPSDTTTTTKVAVDIPPVPTTTQPPALTVPGTPTVLPQTGVNAGIVYLAFGLVLAGIVLVSATRRKSKFNN